MRSFTTHASVCNRISHVSRRDAVVMGASGLLGLSLTQLLHAEAMAGVSSFKSVINIHLDGGPPQHDTIDPKPEAPVEIRGEFRPIATKLPGFQVSELMPKIAGMADRIAFIRSLGGSVGAHDAFQCQSGFAAGELKAIGGRPAVGSVITKLLAQPTDPVPSFVDLMQGRPMVRNSARPGFLGQPYAPFRPDISSLFHRELEPGMKNELAARGPNHAMTLTLTDGLSLERIDDRLQLLAKFDAFRRDLDANGAMDAMDKFSAQAVNILSSGRLARALDLDQEPQSIQKLYTPQPVIEGVQSYTSEDGHAAKKLLLARRLVEAGVRCVSVSFSDFDTHSKNFPRMRNLMPIVDHAIYALITDLANQGMLDEVVVIVWGEFGRMPRINAEGGRDHWPEVGPAMMFGGGVQGGRVVGATDRLGAKVVSRPVSYREIFATIYKCIKIDYQQHSLVDPTGRPQTLLDDAAPIHEIL
jgi:Protein of unknown function (DUF1501)